MNQFALIFVTILSIASAQARVTESVIDAVNVVAASDAPSIPNAAAQFPVQQRPSDLDPIVERMNQVLFPNGNGFQVRFTNIRNIVCDPQRKFIIVDPDTLQTFETGNRVQTRLAKSAILAHEFAHYVVAYLRTRAQKNVFEANAITSLLISNPEHQAYLQKHVQVEAVAFEIMKRAGYTNREIEIGFRSNLAVMERMAQPNETDTIDITNAKNIQATDNINRHAILNQWITENPAIPSWTTSVHRK